MEQATLEALRSLRAKQARAEIAMHRAKAECDRLACDFEDALQDAREADGVPLGYSLHLGTGEWAEQKSNPT